MKKAVIVLFFLSSALLTLALICFLRTYFQPVAIVVPHHNLVQAKRREFFSQIARQRPHTSTVVILSPDHFSPNQLRISYTDRPWNLSNGQLKYDQELGPQLTAELTKRDGVVSQDHGIYNLLPDIKAAWPQAKVVPILIGQSIPLPTLKALSDKLVGTCGQDCLLIASVDFSHYLPSTLANIHDVKSIAALANLDIEPDLEVDSPQSLFLLAQFARQRQAKHWKLYFHSNSGEIASIRDAETTSHVFGYYRRMIYSRPKVSSATFTVARNLNSQSDGSSLGSRFFYGTDRTQLNLQESYDPQPQVRVIPTFGENSYLKFKDSRLEIYLSHDLAVAGAALDNKITLAFLPLTRKEGQVYLTQGIAKTEFFEQLFAGLSPTPAMEADPNLGIIDIPKPKSL